jgi:hypothetical protein
VLTGWEQGATETDRDNREMLMMREKTKKGPSDIVDVSWAIGGRLPGWVAYTEVDMSDRQDQVIFITQKWEHKLLQVGG